MNKKYIVIIAILLIIGGFFLFAGNTTDDVTSDEVADDPTTSQTTSDQDVIIVEPTILSYTENGFLPEDLIIENNTTVKFVNTSNSPFWPASDPHPAHSDEPDLDAGTDIGTDGEFEYTFTKTGIYGIHNHLNSNHTATITVIQ